MLVHNVKEKIQRVKQKEKLFYAYIRIHHKANLMRPILSFPPFMSEKSQKHYTLKIR